MKRFFYFSLLPLLCAAPVLRGQDASSIASRQEADENYKMLKARVDDLSESNTALHKHIQSLEKEIAELRAQLSKPNVTYATPEDLKRLADAVQEIDKKREADKKLILKEISSLGNTLAKAGSHAKETPRVDDSAAPIDPNQPTFTYTVKQGDYLSTIAKAYREQGINVTVDQILKANPGLKATALYPGKKIIIPDTRVSAATKSDSK